MLPRRESGQHWFWWAVCHSFPLGGGRAHQRRPAAEDVEAWVADPEVDMGRPITCGAIDHIMSRPESDFSLVTMKMIGLGSLLQRGNPSHKFVHLQGCLFPGESKLLLRRLDVGRVFVHSVMFQRWLEYHLVVDLMVGCAIAMQTDINLTLLNLLLHLPLNLNQEQEHPPHHECIHNLGIFTTAPLWRAVS